MLKNYKQPVLYLFKEMYLPLSIDMWNRIYRNHGRGCHSVCEEVWKKNQNSSEIQYSDVVHGYSSWGSYSLEWGISLSLFLSLHPLLKLRALKLFLFPKLGTPLLPLSTFLDQLTSSFREMQGEGS